MKKSNLLIIFAKPPIAGKAKTRLIPALGAEGAASLHQKLLHFTLDNLISPRGWDTQLSCASNREHPFFQTCLEGYDITLTSQIEGDLGEKMFHAIDQGLLAYDNVIVVGSDCPALNKEDIQNSFNQLASGLDIVITPAEDGGYVLVGARQKIDKDVFNCIEWGSDTVLDETLKRVSDKNLTVNLQPMLWDVDVPDDLFRLEKENIRL